MVRDWGHATDFLGDWEYASVDSERLGRLHEACGDAVTPLQINGPIPIAGD